MRTTSQLFANKTYQLTSISHLWSNTSPANSHEIKTVEEKAQGNLITHNKLI